MLYDAQEPSAVLTVVLLYLYCSRWEIISQLPQLREWQGRVLPKCLPRARFFTLFTLLRMLAPAFLTNWNKRRLFAGSFPDALLLLVGGGAGLAARETDGLVLGDLEASDKLKLLVRDRTVSNCLADLTKSLSLPNVDIYTRLLYYV